MINTLIPLIDHENVKITRFETYDKPDGGEGTCTIEVGTFLMSVQGIKSSVKVQGFVLDSSLDGSKIDSTFICYSSNIPIKNEDKIQRIERDNLFYEIIATQPKGVGTILEQRETIIKKVDNQGGLNA